MSDPRNLDPRKTKLLDDLFDDLPYAYPDIRFQLMAISEEFRRRCAQALEPKLNEFVRSKNPTTFEEHRTLARLIEDDARWLGLCIASKGEPGVPYATLKPEPGRKAGFAILTREDDPSGSGHFKRVRHDLPADNPHFPIIAGPPGIEDYLLPVRMHAWRAGRSRGGQ